MQARARLGMRDSGLSDKQIAVLHVIHVHPNPTKSVIAEAIGDSRWGRVTEACTKALKAMGYVTFAKRDALRPNWKSYGVWVCTDKGLAKLKSLGLLRKGIEVQDG